MRPRKFQRWAVLLLVGGGVAFAFVGWRMLALQQADHARRGQRRTAQAVARAKADAERLARAPRARPLATWRVEPGRVEVPLTAESARHWARLQRAAGHDGDPAAALRLYAALQDGDLPAWVQDIARLRSGLLLRAQGQGRDARLLLDRAASAHDLLVGLEGKRVRMYALRLLAADGLQQGDATYLERFLDEAEGGVRLSDDRVVGPARFLLELAEDVEAGRTPMPPEPQAQRLRAAAAYGARGVRALGALPGDGAALLEGRLAWRQGSRLALFALDALTEPPPLGYEAAVEVAAYPPNRPLPSGAARLAAPLEGLIVSPLPASGDAAGALLGAALALGFGLLVYVVGAGVALTGWRRSRRAAKQQADFTAAVSHEMKTPIASVRAMAELLAEGGAADPERAQRYAERIGAEMLRLGATVRNVLDAAHVERGSLPVLRVPGDPAAVVERVGAVVRPALLGRGFEVVVDAQPAVEPHSFDAAALEGVLMNLVDNAAKFSADVRVVEVLGYPHAGGYRLAVRDRGIGLESADPEALFQRYYRGEAARLRAVPGVGLGLHIARQVVEAHGGRLRGRTRVGGGAAFEIDLPGASAR